MAAQAGFQALRQFVRPKKAPAEQCELCAAPVPPAHAHLLEPGVRKMLCACQACAILFSSPDAKYRRIPHRVRLLQNFQGADQFWNDLAVPINMAYFYYDSIAAGAKAFYPSPAGATESLLALDSWQDLADANPILCGMEPDVEALLVNRIHTPHEYFLAPIDQCLKLVGLIRVHWRGLSGGTEMWEELAEFFKTLRERALLVEASRA